jgi:arylformamidase
MRLSDYPPQDSPSELARDYRKACVEASFGVPFDELRFGPNPHQSIAVYPSDAPRGPIFIFAHGGGWTNGYKETMGFMAPTFIEHGITFASIGYRLAPDYAFPDGVDDFAAGIALLCEHSASIGFDNGLIFIGGHSSGGHYAALLAVTDDWQTRVGLPRNVVKGCLPISGVFRFGSGAGLSQRPRFLGPEGNGADERASPVLQIADHPPPFLIAYGSKDFPHLMRQATEMIEALRAADGEVEGIVLEGRDHFTASLAGGEANGPWVPTAIRFIERAVEQNVPTLKTGTEQK